MSYKLKKYVKKLLLTIITLFITLFILFLFPLPSLFIDYKGCIEKEERKIKNNVRIYEFIKTTGREQYILDAPRVCIEKEDSRSCEMWTNLNITPQLKEISSNRVIRTGRVIKRYSYPHILVSAIRGSISIIFGETFAFEVLINNKRYWTDLDYYNRMVSGEPSYSKKINTCPLFTIRDLTFRY